MPSRKTQPGPGRLTRSRERLAAFRRRGGAWLVGADEWEAITRIFGAVFLSAMVAAVAGAVIVWLAEEPFILVAAMLVLIAAAAGAAAGLRVVAWFLEDQ